MRLSVVALLAASPTPSVRGFMVTTQRARFGMTLNSGSGNGKPIPPNVPPPERLLDKDEFFAQQQQNDDTSDHVNGYVNGDSGTAKKDRLKSEEEQAQAMIDDISAAVSAIEKISVNGSSDDKLAKVADPYAPSINATALAEQFVDQVIKPMFIQEVQPGVPRDTIKGAALTGALLTFLASKGIIVSSAAGLSAAYVAISQGSAGDALRSLGSIAWEFTTATAGLVQKINGVANRLKQAPPEMQTTDQMATSLSEAVSKSQLKQPLKSSATLNETWADATEEYGDLQAREELNRILLEAEEAIAVADAAISSTDGVYLDEEDEEDDDGPSLEALESKVAKLREEARLAEVEEGEIVDESGQNTQLKSKKEQLTEAARIVDEARRIKEERLADQARLEEAEKRATAQKSQSDRADEVVPQEKSEKKGVTAEEAADTATVNGDVAWFEDDDIKDVYEEEGNGIDTSATSVSAPAGTDVTDTSETIAADRFDEEDEEYEYEYEYEYDDEATNGEVKTPEANPEEPAFDGDETQISNDGDKNKFATNDSSAKSAQDSSSDEYAADDYADEWAAAVNLAQKGIDGKIVGLNDAIADSTTMQEDWDAAQKLAQDLEQGVGEDEFDEDPVADADDIAAAARAAVEKYQTTKQGQKNRKASQRGQWIPADSVSEEYSDDELVARAAREAVEKMNADAGMDVNGSASDLEGDATDDDRSSVPSSRDWESMTVKELRVELRSRGLKISGRKAELVASLQFDDATNGAVSAEGEAQEVDEDDLFDGVDLEELGRQAREAVKMSSGFDENEIAIDWDSANLDIEELSRQARAVEQFVDAEEPSDEVLKQLESEESLLFGGVDDMPEDAPGDGDFQGIAGTKINGASSSSVDLQACTVPQLKDMLRNRGLPVSGRKAALIERLESAQ